MCGCLNWISYNNNNIYFNIAKTKRTTNNTMSYRHICKGENPEKPRAQFYSAAGNDGAHHGA